MEIDANGSNQRSFSNKVTYLYGSIPVEANAAMALDMISLTTRVKFRDK